MKIGHASGRSLWLWHGWLLVVLGIAGSARAQSNVAVERADAPTNGVVEPAAVEPEASPLTEARASLRVGNLDDALALAEAALARDPNSVDWLRIKGSIARRRGDTRNARTTYERLLKVAPGDPSAKAVLALLLQEDAHAASPKAAVALLERAYRLADEDPALALEWCEMARRAAQPQALVTAYELLHARVRSRPDLRRAAADAYIALGRPAEAAPLYELLLTATPEDAELGRALIAAFTAADPAGVAALLDAAARRFPANVAILRAQSIDSHAKANPIRGLRSLSAILLADPKDAEAAIRRLNLLADLGGASLALAALGTYGEMIETNVQRRVRERAAAQQQEWRAIDATLPAGGPTEPLVLAYGEVADPAPADSPAIDMRTLVRHLEYFREHGYRMLSPRDLSAALRHKTALPPRSVVLIFRGPVINFDQLVLPILEQYKCPAVLAIATIELATAGNRMAPAEFRAMATHPLVTLATHSHALNTHVQSNPQGRLSPAAASRLYSPVRSAYETVDEYRVRVLEDIKQSQTLLQKAVGQPVDILVWPDRGNNAYTLADVGQLDITLMFTEAQPTSPTPDGLFPFLVVAPTLTLADLAARAQRWGNAPPAAPPASFGMSAELDSVVGNSADETRARLEALVQRAVDAGVDSVYLAAWSDANHDGLAEALYFQNRALPVKADILNHAVSLFQYRGLRVYVVMPTLGIRPPGIAPDPRWSVMEYRWGQIRPTPPPRARLSPFHPESRKLVQVMFQDLAAYVDFDGVLFRNDAYLTDNEDFGPEAARVNREKLGLRERNPEAFTPEQTKAWTALRVATIDELLDNVKRSVLALRPGTRMGRAVFGPAALSENGSIWFAQDYAQALASQDFVWVDATPEIYGPDDPSGWLTQLVAAIQRTPAGMDKTILALGLFDESRQDWVSTAAWRKRLAGCRNQGMRQFAYFPDGGPAANRPSVRAIREAADANRMNTPRTSTGQQPRHQ